MTTIYKHALALFLIGSCFRLRADTILNGDFATGALDNWLVAGTDGNAQVLSTFGSKSPTGTNFAIISDGPGAVNTLPILDSTTLASSSFLVSSGDFLKLRYDFISDEPNDGSGNPDFFSIELIGSSRLTLASGMVTSGTPQILITGGPIVLQDGTTFFYENGFATLNTSLGAFVGQNVSVQFLVSDATDNSGDSGILIDNVQVLAQNSPVPEANTSLLAFLAGGTFIAVILARSRNKTTGADL